MTKPFQQGRFRDLPDVPRVPHRYFDLPWKDVQVHTDAFGALRTHVRFAGAESAPPLLLIHGLMTSSYSFRYVLDALGARHRLIIPDLPGAGRTERAPHVEHSPENLADFLIELTRALDVEGCLALGNSMGGYLAMYAALRSPKTFRALVNVHSPGLPTGRMVALGAAMKVSALRRVAAAMFGVAPLRFVHANVHYFDESLKSLEEAREYGAVLADRTGAESLVRYLGDALSIEGMRRFETTLRARKTAGEPFPVPLQLVYADRDPMVPASLGPRLAALVPSAELVVLRETSHFAHVDTPQRLAEPVLAFLGRA